VKCVAERLQDLKVDDLKDRLGRVELDEEDDEYAVVRQLLEIRPVDVVVLKEHADNYPKHLRTWASTERQ